MVAVRGAVGAVAVVVAVGVGVVVAVGGGMIHTIGASEVAVLLGLQRRTDDGEPWTSEFTLWCRLTGQLPRYDDVSSPDAALGKMLEPLIGMEYARREGVSVFPGPALDQPGLTHPDLPFLHVRPDFYVASCRRVLEVKAPRSFHPERWGEGGTDQIPPEYLVQVLMQLAVLYRMYGWTTADLAALARAPGWGDDRVFEVYRVERDAATEAAILDRVRGWYDEHVVGGKVPMTDGSRSTSASLRWWGAEPGKARAATEEDEQRLHRLTAIRGTVADLKSDESLLRNQVTAAMGDATELVDHTGRLLATFRPNKNGVRVFRTKEG